jgi:cation-transporting ATPase I
VLHRGIATGLPSFVAYMLGSRTTNPAHGQAVAFTSVVATQLAQTLDLGQAEGGLSPEVLGAVSGSAAFVAAALMFPPFQRFLDLALPTPFGLALCAAAMLASLAISRALAAGNGLTTSRAT